MCSAAKAPDSRKCRGRTARAGRLHHRDRRLQRLLRQRKKIPDEIETEIDKGAREARKADGQEAGRLRRIPLLLSVRSGAKFSMPGMMNTILNLGLNDETTAGLAKKSGNPRFAYDCYRRFIQMFGEVALDIDMEKFDHIFDARKAKVEGQARYRSDGRRSEGHHRDYKKLVQKETGKAVSRRSARTAHARRGAVFGSWWNDKAAYYRKMEKIPDDIGTAANVQAMVFGNMGDTRPPASASRAIPAPAKRFSTANSWSTRRAKTWSPASARRSRSPISKSHARSLRAAREITTNLEKHYKDMQDFEFTIQDKKLYMLQTRNGKRTGPAAVRIAVDMVEEGMITKKEAVMRVAPQQLDQLLHPVFDPPKTLKELTKLTTGISASPGAAVGRVAFSAEDAVEWPPRSGASGPQGNHAGRHSRHGRFERHSDGHRRQVQPRGRGGARHGPALRGRARAHLHRRAKKIFTASWAAKPSR
jgi:pyruvate,orthophosphate dikinase